MQKNPWIELLRYSVKKTTKLHFQPPISPKITEENEFVSSMLDDVDKGIDYEGFGNRIMITLHLIFGVSNLLTLKRDDFRCDLYLSATDNYSFKYRNESFVKIAGN